VSQPISRVLSRTVIHLGLTSLQASSNLPESSASSTVGFLFGLAPSGVYHATNCYQLRGALLPHPFTLTCAIALYKRKRGHRRSTLCCTFRRLTPPRGYLALCPMEPGLSSPTHPISPMEISRKRSGDRPANSRGKGTMKQTIDNRSLPPHRHVKPPIDIGNL